MSVNTLEKLKEWTTQAAVIQQPSRTHAYKEYMYFEGEQLSAQTLKELADRGQPEFWINLYKMIANKVTGYKIDTRTVIKVNGRQQDDDAKGKIYTDILRSMTDSVSSGGIDYYAEKALCDLDLMLGGLCAMEPRIKLLGEQDERGRALKELEFVRIDPEEILTDPFAKTLDYRDARFVTRYFAVPIEEVYAKYGSNSVSAVTMGDSLSLLSSIGAQNAYDLRGYGSYSELAFLRYTWYWEWNESCSKKVMKYAVWHESKLLECEESPYALTSFPIAVRRLFMGKKLKHYGLFSDLRPIQDQVNYNSLRLASMLGATKLLVEEDAVDDLDEFARDWRRDNAVVSVRRGAIAGGTVKEIQQDNRIAQVQARINELIAYAKTITGFNDEALGVAVNRLSGDAIEQRQRTGLMGLLHFIDASANFDKQVFMAAISHIRQYFDAKQAFFVTEIGADAARRVEADASVLQIGRFDITVDFVPVQAGSKTERYRLNMEALKIVQQIKPELVEKLLPLFLKDSDAPLAEAVIREIAAAKEEAGQDQNAAAAQEAQLKRLELEMAKLQSEIEKNQAKAAKDAMDAAVTRGELGDAAQ